MSDTLLEAQLETPHDGYENLKLRVGVLSEEPKRVVFEFSKQEYQFEAEILFTQATSFSQV